MSIAFVFASKDDKAEGHITPYMTDPANLDYDTYFLCSETKEKVLKKDVDLDLEALDDYDIVCLVGAEPLKYVLGMTGVTKYNGVQIQSKYFPLMHPRMTTFKPQYIPEIQKAMNKIELAAEGNLNVTINEKYYEFIETEEAFAPLLAKLIASKVIVVDIETSSLSPRRGNILGVAFSTKAHEGYYVSAELIKKHKDTLHQLFLETTCVFHNAKFDMSFLKYEYGFDFPYFDDTMLLHYCLEEAVGTHGLKPLALRFTDLGDYERALDDYKKTFARKNKIKLADFNYGMLPTEILAPYACKDGDGTFQLYNKFQPLVVNSDRFSSLYDTILKPATIALLKLEANGGPISMDKLNSLIDSYQIDIDECLEEISMNPAIDRFEKLNSKTFNPNSVNQLREVFFNILAHRPIKKTDTGAWSVDKEVLGMLDDPLAAAVLDLREKRKMLGTYLSNIANGVDKDSRLRSSFNIHGTTSGRLSSSGVLNYQNIPRDNKDIKKIFTAREGYQIVQCDLKTAEVYYAAVLSGDKFLQQAFVDKVDFHSYIAKSIFKLDCPADEVKYKYPDHRQWAKAITFGIMYQAGPAKIAETANVSFEEAKKFIAEYFRNARELKKFIQRSNDFIEANHYIYAHFNRKRRLPEAGSENKGVAKHAVRSGVNFLVQSVASDVNLYGVIDCMDWIEENNLNELIIPFTVVHDSIVVEVHDSQIDNWVTNSRELVQRDRGLSIPNCPIGLDYEIGPSWGDLRDYK